MELVDVQYPKTKITYISHGDTLYNPSNAEHCRELSNKLLPMVKCFLSGRALFNQYSCYVTCSDELGISIDFEENEFFHLCKDGFIEKKKLFLELLARRVSLAAIEINDSLMNLNSKARLADIVEYQAWEMYGVKYYVVNINHKPFFIGYNGRFAKVIVYDGYIWQTSGDMRFERDENSLPQLKLNLHNKFCKYPATEVEQTVFYGNNVTVPTDSGDVTVNLNQKPWYFTEANQWQQAFTTPNAMLLLDSLALRVDKFNSMIEAAIKAKEQKTSQIIIDITENVVTRIMLDNQVLFVQLPEDYAIRNKFTDIIPDL